MHTVWQKLDIPGSYFESPEDSIAGDESLEQTRYADQCEVLHTASVASYNWEKAWQPKGASECPLKGHVADSVFFHPLIYTPNDSDSPAAVLR